MSDDNEVFYWQHSYSRVFIPESSYSPTDGFMSFEHYNVEIRDRVKCISAAEGRRLYPLSNTAANIMSRTFLKYRHSVFGRRAFSVAGPMAWNSLPDSL